MRGAYQIPQGDWTSRDSLAEVTEIYLRPEETDPAVATVEVEMPVIPRRFTPQQQHLAPQAARYEMPSLAVYATGSSPSVRISERLDATHRVTRQPARFPLLAAGVIGAIAVGVLVGLVVAFSGPTNIATAAPAPAPIQAVTVTPIVVPVAKPAVKVTPIVAPAPVMVPALVDLRVDSQPSGGIATLIDGPKATQLGATPLAVSLDPKRSYDIMVSMEGHTPRVMHVTPTAGAELMLKLDDVTPAAAPVVVVAKPRHLEKAVTEKAVAEKGLLRISSKPPCAITIDGKPSGKTTPQAALALSVGTHEVTLTNEEQGINLTTEVEIRADKPTAVVQDFTK
jgi:hypothetical protein